MVIKIGTGSVTRKQWLVISLAIICFVLALLPFYFLYWKCVFTGYPQPSTTACLLIVGAYAGLAMYLLLIAFRRHVNSQRNINAEATVKVPGAVAFTSKALLLLSTLVALYLVWFGIGFSKLYDANEVAETRSESWLSAERALFGDEAAARILNAIGTGRLNNRKSNGVTLWCLQTAQALIKEKPRVAADFRGELSNNLGRSYEIEGDNDAAVRSYFDTLAALAPNRDHETEYSLYVAACKIGARTAALGDYGVAVSAYKLALGTDTAREDPGIAAPIRAQFALALQNNGEYSMAEEQYMLAIRHAEGGLASWTGKREDLRTCQSTMSYAALLGHYEELLVAMGKKEEARAVGEKLARYLAVGEGK